MTKRFGAFLAGFVALTGALSALAGCGAGHPDRFNNSGGNGNFGGGTNNSGTNATTTTNGVPGPPTTTNGTNTNPTNGTNTNPTNGTNTNPTNGNPTPPPPTPTAVTVGVNWGARTTRVALSSALSATLTFQGARAPSGDLVIVANRNRDVLPAFTQTYTSTETANPGTYTLIVNFYAGENGSGDLVGTRTVTGLVIPADGTIGLNLDAETVRIKRVEVVAGQSLLFGDSRVVAFAAYDATTGGAIVPLTDGSATVQVSSGNGLIANGVSVTATRPGATFVTATVDGVTSNPVAITVTSNARVVVGSPAVVASLGETITVSATVEGVPDSERNNVVYSIAEGEQGGVIDQLGRYTAPASLRNNDVPDLYRIVATSGFDPSKSAIIEVRVDLLLDVRPIVNGLATVAGSEGTVSINKTLQLRENPLVDEAQPALGRVRNRPQYDVIYEVLQVPLTDVGAISGEGLYLAPAQRGRFIVRVRSVQYPSRVVDIPINVVSGIGNVIID